MTDAPEPTPLDRERDCARAVEAARLRLELAVRAVFTPGRPSTPSERNRVREALAALDAAREALRAAEAVPR